MPGVDLGLPAGTRQDTLLDTKKGYVLLSAHFGYRINEHLDVELHVRNLFVKDYYDIYGVVPRIMGEPRTFSLIANDKF